MSDQRRVCLCRAALHDVDEHAPVSEAQLFRGYGIALSPELDVVIQRQPIPREILDDLEQTEHRLSVVRSDAA